METETIATPWSATRQRRYDELCAEIAGDRQVLGSAGTQELHQRVMERLDAESAALRERQP